MRDKILFVDDDKAVLDTLRSRLSHMEDEWEMSYSIGGEEAVERLRLGEFSVVVADLDNKNLNGAEFLGRVRTEAPLVARVVFSSKAEDVQGENIADDDSFYLLKGCGWEPFVMTIREACIMHHTLKAHPRPISTEELLEVLIEFLGTAFLRGKINLDDVPKRIRPYVSRQVLRSDVQILENPIIDSSLAQRGAWFDGPIA